MRLPLFIIQSLLVRTDQLLTIGMAILLLGMVSVGASAANSQLACTPPNLRFGAINVGQTETLLVTVTNNGKTSATVSGIAVGNSEFTTSSLSLPLVLSAGQSVNLSVSFAPTTTGWTGGTIKFFSNASTANLSVGGTGISSEPLSASPSIVSFGQVAIGATSSVPVVLTNARSWQVTLWSAQTTGRGFSISGPSFPVTLGVGQSVRLNVVFAPQSAGATGGSLFVSGPALAIPLTGTGIAAAHSSGQLTANPASLAFGSAQVGRSLTLTDSLTNTGGSSVTISQATATGAGFSISGLSVPLVLNPGASVPFSAVFTPQSAASANGGITVVSNASNSALTVPLSGTGTAAGQLTSNPANLAFGSAQVGSSLTLTDSLTNTGGSSVTISQATATGAGFSISGLSVPVVLNPRASVHFSVVSNASNSTLTVSLSGTGTAAGQLTSNPASLAFGSAKVGSSVTLANSLMNTGGASVTISQATATGAGFSISGLSVPFVLSSGASVPFSAVFTPQSAVSVNGGITVVSNASNSTLTVPLSGTGTAAGQLTSNPANLAFGSAQVGSSLTLTDSLTNTGGSSVTISQATATGAGFSISGLNVPFVLNPGASVPFSAVFTPQSAASVNGGITVVSNASNSTLTVSLSGTGTAAGQLTSNPANLAFGSAQVGSSLTLTDSLTNTGGSSVTISQATATGTGFSISGLNVPLVLNPGASVTFSARFNPQSAVSVSGGITVVSNASNSTLTVSLSGTGTAPGQITLAPTALNFGNATVGSNVSQASSLSATGASVTVSSASLSSAKFSLTGISLPVTIAAGQSVPVTMTFSPQASGSASGILSVASNASNAPTQTLSGVGVAPPQHSVSLSWTDANSGIAGYNVYRGNSAGGPFTQINSGLDATPAYSDTSVAAGQTYYYVATAVNESGAESAYSNEVQGAVPSP